MPGRSSLSEGQREAAVALFESGLGWRAVARRLGVGPKAVERLHILWRVRGRGALVAKTTRQVYAFEVKWAIVQRFLAGETSIALAQAYGLSSPKLVAGWVRTYRVQGEDGLRPKPSGHPTRDPVVPVGEESELERLRRENERLRAEVAYLGKLTALMSHERR